jgi:transglutaminase-like putative cysteine protease
MPSLSSTHERMLQVAVALVSALGVIMLAMGQRDARLALVALGAIAASLVLTDIKQWLRLNSILANIAGLTAVAISLGDFMRFDNDTQLFAIANLLIYLQIVLLFQPKTLRVYWQILVLSLLEVVVGAALNLGAMFGVLMVLYMLLMLLTLSLLFVARESIELGAAETTDYRRQPVSGSQAMRDDKIVVLPAASNPSANLLAKGIFRQLASASLTTVLVAAAVFFSIPRLGTSMWSDGSGSFQNTVGFSSTVSLGALGEIAENDELVMRVEFRHADQPAQPYKVDGEPLFRGSVLTHYSRGRWIYNHRNRRGALWPLPEKPPRAPAVLQRITIEPLSEPVVFGIYPIFRARGSRRAGDVRFDLARRRFIRSEEAQESQYKFESLTTGFRSGSQHPITSEVYRRADEIERDHAQLLQLPFAAISQNPQPGPGYTPQRRDDARPDEELTELVATAQREIARAALDPDDPQYTIKRARVLERYLHSPRFSYTLAQQPRDPELDPVEDFIRNNPRGHCEYFASALALMLRSQGIPSRVVVGFKGGDYNQVGDFYLVRQLHAHAWVEAYLSPEEIPPELLPADPLPEGGGGWLTLDPTPVVDGVSGYNIGGVLATLADLGDYLQHLWSTYVVGLTAERQRESIYQPLSEFTSYVEQLVDEYGGGNVATAIWVWLSVNALTVQGMLILLIVAMVAVFVGKWTVRITGRLYRSLRRATASKQQERVEFYDRLVRILARYGVRRTGQQTPLEFALVAGAELVADSDTRTHATLPRRIVEMYYRVRFGRHPLDRREAESVEQQLATLDRLSRQRRNGRSAARTNDEARMT